MSKRPTTSRSSRKPVPLPIVKKGRKPVPENETRHARFVRLGTKRMNSVIRQIQLLGNLASPNYDCEPEDIALMQTTITRELDATFARFIKQRKAASIKAGFAFKPPNGSAIV